MIDLRLGDCIEQMKTLGDGSIDAIITDPPYPEISRDYGRMSEAEWHEMMRGVVAQARRVLNPTGSAVFILQPNSRKVGSMRPWLFEFQAWACREWNIVQDAYWWNTSALPLGGAPKFGLMRPSVKHAVWIGPPDCYRDQESVLIAESDQNSRERIRGADVLKPYPSRARSVTENLRDSHKRMRSRCASRGGTTPFNVVATGSGSPAISGQSGHGAGTPAVVCDWWTRYICPPGGTILDPFAGSGTTGLSAIKYGCSYVGIEKKAEYHAIAERRLAAASNQTPLFAG
jgi:DNA modification methylase